MGGSDTDDDDGAAAEMRMLLPDLCEDQHQRLVLGGPEAAEQQQQQHYLQSINATLVTRQLPSQGLSFQIWPASATLVSLLDRDPSPLLLPPPPLRILELGSGTGLLGIAAAALLGASVTLTDLPHVLPNLRFNALANAPAIAARGGSVDVRALTWGEDGGGGGGGTEFDVVVASDVVYYDHLFDPLLQTLCSLVKGEVVFVMAHLRRWKKRDDLFFRKARKVFDVAAVYTDAPLIGCRTGVVVYRFTAKGSQPPPPLVSCTA